MSSDLRLDCTKCHQQFHHEDVVSKELFGLAVRSSSLCDNCYTVMKIETSLTHYTIPRGRKRKGRSAYDVNTKIALRMLRHWTRSAECAPFSCEHFLALEHKILKRCEHEVAVPVLIKSLWWAAISLLLWMTFLTWEVQFQPYCLLFHNSRSLDFRIFVSVKSVEKLVVFQAAHSGFVNTLPLTHSLHTTAAVHNQSALYEAEFPTTFAAHNALADYVKALQAVLKAMDAKSSAVLMFFSSAAASVISRVNFLSRRSAN